MFTKRTDLALEARELWQESAERTTRLAGVKAVRRKLAAENAAVYLSAMARLGYSRGEAMELLKEENHT